MKSLAKGVRAFTLIELLIVVAIIAILAAIAVPNFLEAQVRSKVSRAKADMRSLATAIESYYVDYNRYAPPSDVDGDVLFPARMANKAGEGEFPEGFETYAPSVLTTPIAYMTSLPADPFPQRNVDEVNFLFHYTTRAYFLQTEGDAEELDEFIEEMIGSRNSSIQWYLMSHGPDLDHDSPELDENPLGPALYDPTNGTVSSGDIVMWGPGVGFAN